MDGSSFDQLIKQLGTTRVTRLTALRGLAVGAVAAAIGIAAPDEVDAKCKKNCAQCLKKVKKKTKSGKVRCRCRAKANGTACSIPGATTATTCLNGTCVAAATPTPLPPPGFNCTTAGCVGVNAGLVCNTTTGACVTCQTFADCGALQACFSGRCQGFVRCNGDGDCAGIAPSGLRPGLICNDATPLENPEIEAGVCIFNPLEGACNNTNDCVPFMGRPVACVLGACFADCRQAGDDDCDKFYIPGTHHCVGGICFV
jgi:hypothetical protein